MKRLAFSVISAVLVFSIIFSIPALAAPSSQNSHNSAPQDANASPAQLAEAAKPTNADKASDKPSEPTAATLDAVVQNCSSIKRSLAQLQRVDSRTRVYLGASFETVANTFISPLSLRLSRNNREDDTLSAIQSTFVSGQASFRSVYTAYMRELDALIAIDCQASPQDFYAQLLGTRARREELRLIANKLSGLVDSQIKAVSSLKSSLEGKEEKK